MVTPCTYCDNTCDYCVKGLQSSCRHGGRYGYDGVDGGQGEAVRVPQTDGTLVKLPVEPDSGLLPSLLGLSDVMGTGHHSAVTAGIRPGDSVLVIGDGAVGLCVVVAVRRLGAERIVLMGRRTERTGLGRAFGATDVVAERGDDGDDRVVEAVGTRRTLETALGANADGGTISRLGVHQYEEGPVGAGMIMRNVTLTGGVSPARASIEELLPDVLSGAIQPGRVSDRTISLDEVPQAYQDMAGRRVLKPLIRF